MPTPPAPRPWTIYPCAAAIVAAIIVAYANIYATPFVFDDNAAILENATIRQLWPLTIPLSPPATGIGVTGRPLVNLSFALNYAVGGYSVRGYHVTNVALHALAALTLFGLLRRTFLTAPLRARFGAAATWLAAAITLAWSAHPLLTECVTSTVQRTESLVSLWYLLTMYAFVRFATEDRPHAKNLWFAAAVAACALGMATKEVMVTAPVMALLYDRTFLAGSFAACWRLRRRTHFGLASTWLILAWLVASLGGARGHAAGTGLGVSTADYVLTQFHALTLYLKLAFWPRPLVFDYGFGVLHSVAEVAPEMALILALVAGTTIALWRWPTIGFLGAWFFGILAPSSSIIPLVGQTIAEHRMYLPLMAVLVLVFGALYRFAGRISIAIALLLVPVLIAATLARNRVYQSELDLWTDTAAHAPKSWRALNTYAEKLIAAGRGLEAYAPAMAAYHLGSDYPELLNNVGIALAQAGRPVEAIEPYEAALKLKPGYAGAHANLGAALARLGRFDEAERHLKKGLELNPDAKELPTLHLNLGNVYLQTGRLNAAIDEYEAVLKLDANHIDAHFNRGAALAQLGRFNDAADEFRIVLRLNPQHPVAQRALDQLPQ